MAMGAAPAHVFPTTAVQPLLLPAATPAATKTPLPTTSDLDVQLQVELTYTHTTVTESLDRVHA